MSAFRTRWSPHDLASRVRRFFLRLTVTTMRSRSVVRKFQLCRFDRNASTKLVVVTGPITKRPLFGRIERPASARAKGTATGGEQGKASTPDLREERCVCVRARVCVCVCSLEPGRDEVPTAVLSSGERAPKRCTNVLPRVFSLPPPRPAPSNAAAREHHKGSAKEKKHTTTVDGDCNGGTIQSVSTTAVFPWDDVCHGWDVDRRRFDLLFETQLFHCGEIFHPGARPRSTVPYRSDRSPGQHEPRRRSRFRAASLGVDFAAGTQRAAPLPHPAFPARRLRRRFSFACAGQFSITEDVSAEPLCCAAPLPTKRRRKRRRPFSVRTVTYHTAHRHARRRDCHSQPTTFSPFCRSEKKNSRG